MSRTTTREIIRVCADLARMDRRGKEEVLRYLNDELKNNVARSVMRSLAMGTMKEPMKEKEGDK